MKLSPTRQNRPKGYSIRIEIVCEAQLARAREGRPFVLRSSAACEGRRRRQRHFSRGATRQRAKSDACLLSLRSSEEFDLVSRKGQCSPRAKGNARKVRGDHRRRRSARETSPAGQNPPNRRSVPTPLDQKLTFVPHQGPAFWNAGSGRAVVYLLRRPLRQPHTSPCRQEPHHVHQTP